MSEKAAYLVDQIMPCVPVRQFVITFGYPLRYLLAYNAELCGAIARIAVQCVFSWMRHRAKDTFGLRSVTEAHCGAVTAIQRARSDLRSSIHLHNVVFDGVFVQSAAGTALRFRALPPPDATDRSDLLLIRSPVT
jgi:hypothetical protein